MVANRNETLIYFLFKCVDSSDFIAMNNKK